MKDGFWNKVDQMDQTMHNNNIFSVLINGSPEGFFFVIGMEVFSNLVDKAASGGLLTGFNIENRQGEEEQITHLLFADDTLVFCNDTREKLAYLSWVLLWFEAIRFKNKFGKELNPASRDS